MRCQPNSILAGPVIGSVPTCCPSCRRHRRRRGWSRRAIRDDLLDFLTADGSDIELWAWIGAYDHVAICQLRQRDRRCRGRCRGSPVNSNSTGNGGEARSPPAPDDAHDALSDARHNLRRWEAIEAAPGYAGR